MCQGDSQHRRERKGEQAGKRGKTIDIHLIAAAAQLRLDACTCFSFSSSMRSLSSMQLRACRKAFLWARSVRMRTNSPDRLTLVNSTVLATNCKGGGG